MRAPAALVALLAVLFPVAFALAAGPFEPNDSPADATGPLASAQSRAASIERRGDSDFYFFYVTSARPRQVTLTLDNLGGGPASSVLNAAVTDSSATPIGALQYVGEGHGESTTLTLAPQKYFVEVTATEAFDDRGDGDSYRLTATAAGGALGPYERIASRCGEARRRLGAVRRSLRIEQARRQRSVARLRLARIGPPRARRRARAAHRRLLARIARKRRARRAAALSLRPWCSISP